MAKDDEFLREFFVDCQSAMRWRGEAEWKLLNLFMVLPPIIVATMLGVSELVDDKTLSSALILSMAAFLTVLTILLTIVLVSHTLNKKLLQHCHSERSEESRFALTRYFLRRKAEILRRCAPQNDGR